MRTVRICGPVAKVVREVADYLNSPDCTAPKAVEGPGVTFLITDEPLTLQLMKHEKRHEYQAWKLRPQWMPEWGPLKKLSEWIGWTRFYKQYAAEYGEHGYWNNRFEMDARQASGEEQAGSA